jgi:rRNA maturation endonuclease Nob1
MYWRNTTCEECGTRLKLTTIDGDGVLIGDECPSCGYYVTRYMPGQEPK